MQFPMIFISSVLRRFPACFCSHFLCLPWLFLHFRNIFYSFLYFPMLLLSLPLPTMVFPTCSQYFPPLYAVFPHITMFLLSFPLPAMIFPAFWKYFPPFASSAYHGISYMFQVCSSVIRCFPAFSLATTGIPKTPTKVSFQLQSKPKESATQSFESFQPISDRYHNWLTPRSLWTYIILLPCSLNFLLVPLLFTLLPLVFTQHSHSITWKLQSSLDPKRKRKKFDTHHFHSIVWKLQLILTHASVCHMTLWESQRSHHTAYGNYRNTQNCIGSN